MLPVNIGMYKFFGIIKGKSNNYEDIRLLGTLSSKKLFFFYWLPMQISDQFYFLAITFKFDKMKKNPNSMISRNSNLQKWTRIKALIIKII